MTQVDEFGPILFLVGLVLGFCVLASRLSEHLRIPTAAAFLVGSALASDLYPALYAIPFTSVERVVTLCLIFILFDGGMEMGYREFRRTAPAAGLLGVAGTLATAGAGAALAHYLFGLAWHAALLIGVALSPTDPAVVFSVLGSRLRIRGGSDIILKSEAGLNDPVSIALMVGLLAPSGSVLLTFGLQMLVGGLLGVAGGMALLGLMRRVPLPSKGLSALAAVSGALMLFGCATVAHGSGFLAVFVAGIWIGDEDTLHHREIQPFFAVLTSLSEIVAFTLLGVTVSLAGMLSDGAWAVGLVLAVLTSFLVRPLLVGPLLLPLSLTWRERALVLLAGLKGAVPILMAAFVVSAGLSEAIYVYQVVFVVVAFSVVVQGTMLPWLAYQLGLAAEDSEPAP